MEYSSFIATQVITPIADSDMAHLADPRTIEVLSYLGVPAIQHFNDGDYRLDVGYLHLISNDLETLTKFLYNHTIERDDFQEILDEYLAN